MTVGANNYLPLQKNHSNHKNQLNQWFRQGKTKKSPLLSGQFLYIKSGGLLLHNHFFYGEVFANLNFQIINATT